MTQSCSTMQTHRAGTVHAQNVKIPGPDELKKNEIQHTAKVRWLYLYILALIFNDFFPETKNKKTERGD